MKYKRISAIIFIAASLFSCKPAEVLLHGDISGVITDAETSQLIQGVSAKLINTTDSTTTGNDGSFLFRNVNPGPYEIKASKAGYDSIKQDIEVVPAQTKQLAFSLNGIPVPKPSVTYLDFSLDSTSVHFTLSNLGKGKFSYFIDPSQEWITVSPRDGKVTDSIKIKVTINRNGLSQNIYNEAITIISVANQVTLPQIIIPVTLNGVRDHDGNYYKVVRIGQQIWMAENINVGTAIPIDKSPDNNGIIEKYCYLDSKGNCDTYGGIYRWDEMMQYNPSDTIGTTQGICPVGWHIPSRKDWAMLAENVGGRLVAGAQLKEAGLEHWLAPNVGATNESGFSAIPGGFYSPPDHSGYGALGIFGSWWSSNEYYLKNSAYVRVLFNDTELLDEYLTPTTWGVSVRCVKNPGKK